MEPNYFQKAKRLKVSIQDIEYNVINYMNSVLGTIATTKKREIAEEYNNQRLSKGELYNGVLPDNCILHNVQYNYMGLKEPPEGPFFKSQQMEDKFDIYKYGKNFYITRSWTGDLIIVTKLTIY